MVDIKVTVLVLVDFSNVFNTADHEIFLYVLKYLKLFSEALEWFSTYLQGWQQCICVKDSIFTLPFLSYRLHQLEFDWWLVSLKAAFYLLYYTQYLLTLELHNFAVYIPICRESENLFADDGRRYNASLLLACFPVNRINFIGTYILFENLLTIRLSLYNHARLLYLGLTYYESW